MLNPSRKRFPRTLRALQREAASTGRDVTILLTTVEDPGPGQARRALAEGASAVVVGGGDGTVRLVAGVLAGSGVPLGILPCGTANLFARNLGLHPSRVRRNVRLALGGVSQVFDLGLARYRRGDTWSGEEPFLVVGGVGNDAATVLATPHGSKHRLGWLAYFSAGVRHLLRPALPMTVTADGTPAREVWTWCVLAGNCGGLPGGVRVFPDAEPDDGVLDTLLVPLRRPTQWLGVAAKGLLRLRRRVSALEYGRARVIDVRPAHPQPLQLDGDAVPAVDQAVFRVAPSALLVRVDGRRRQA